MSIKLQVISGISSSVKRNSMPQEIEAPYSFLRFLRWTVHSSQADWNPVIKATQGVLDWIGETAECQNNICIQSASKVFTFAAKAALVPVFLKSIDAVLFESSKTWMGVTKKWLNLILAVFRIASATFGYSIFTIPLSYIFLAQSITELVTQMYLWKQMEEWKEAFGQDTTCYTSGGITQEELVTATNQAQGVQKIRVVEAIVCLSVKVFSNMYPAMKLANALASGLSSVFSMSISCYREMNFDWHFKLDSL